MFKELENILKQRFLDYADSHLSDDPVIRNNILLKREHTLRVCSHAMAIADSISADRETSFLAYCSALMHDCGRFQQFVQYRTFHDATSVDHGLLGATVVDDSSILDGLNNEMRTIIKNVVRYHNCWILPDHLDYKTRKILSIIRDSDKLDIMHLMTEHFLKNTTDPYLVLHLPDTPGYSPEVYTSLMEGRTITNAMRRNLNDMKLGYLAWVFDLNYAYSIRHVIDNNMLDAIVSTLPDCGDIQMAHAHVRKYMQNKLDNLTEVI